MNARSFMEFSDRLYRISIVLSHVGSDCSEIDDLYHQPFRFNQILKLAACLILASYKMSRREWTVNATLGFKQPPPNISAQSWSICETESGGLLWGKEDD
jgi:hypothetical protein